jgi:hypothetical protein
MMSQTTYPQYDLEDLASPLIALLDEYRDQFTGWVKIHQIAVTKSISSPRLKRHPSTSSGIRDWSSCRSTRCSGWASCCGKGNPTNR